MLRLLLLLAFWADESFTLKLRQQAPLERQFAPSETAIVICDMWDKHWCTGATQRVGVLAQKMVPVLAAARQRGILVIHAPSETMDFYKDHPGRLRILGLEKIAPPAPLDITSPPLPIDDSKGGCDTGDKFYKAWSREIAAIPLDDRDLISDNGQEIYSALKLRGIKNLLVMGVHTNMCILNRTFAIKQMTKWGMHCVLVRDLTDSMYDPKEKPFVDHDRGTELVVEYIEKYWAPSVLSKDLLAALKR